MGAALGGLGLLSGLAASASAESSIPTPTDKEVTDSIVPLDLRIAAIDLRIKPLETTATDGAEQVLTLNSDILFSFDKATISAAAKRKMGELVQALPQKAKVTVGGHTDSLGTPARNLILSQARATTVGAAITAARPDLVISIKGFGEARPVASNGTAAKDDPEGRAKNRRVEIRFAS
ncbi:MAG: OmpA family protein [Knoellia sp.]